MWPCEPDRLVLVRLSLTAPPEVGRYPRDGIVMDIGCGNGEQLTCLRNAGYRAIGLELAPEAAHACHKVGHSVIIARAACLPLRSSVLTLTVFQQRATAWFAGLATAFHPVLVNSAPQSYNESSATRYPRDNFFPPAVDVVGFRNPVGGD